MIRLAATDDIATMRALEVEAGARFAMIGMPAVAASEPTAAVDLQARIALDRVWVATSPPIGSTAVEAAVVGLAYASIVDGTGHLDEVAVATHAGRQGIGSALVRHVAAWAREQGHEALTLTTFRDVAFNGPVYERLGFELIPPESYGRELGRIRADEVAIGLDDHGPRIAMRLVLGH